MTRKEQSYLRAFEQYGDALFRHSFFRLSDRDRALELTQDAFIRGWEYIRSGGEIRDYRPFLYKTLNNLIIDEYRKRKSVSLDALLEDENVSPGVFPELVDDPRAELMARLDGERLLKLLKDMPEQYRQVVTLRYVDGFSPKQIASMLDASENLVSVRIHRGIAWLKKEAENHEQF